MVIIIASAKRLSRQQPRNSTLGVAMLAFDRVAVATGVLAGLYCLLAIHCYYKLKYLHGFSKDLNTRKLLTMSCFLTSILRVMSFTTITTFAVGELDLKSSLEGDDISENGKEEFFDKSMIVLFDLPDFSIISAYMLIVIVWAESFLLSRRHWMSSVHYRRTWLLGYLIFNSCLYTVQVSSPHLSVSLHPHSCQQVALYSFLLLPSINKVCPSSPSL
jgi:hypothetical protein